MTRLKNQHDALIDKTVLTGFTVTRIQNPEALFRTGILIQQSGPQKRILLDNCEFNSIQLPESTLFDRFVYMHGPHGLYAELDLSIQEHVPADELRTGHYKQEYHNLNCWHVADLKRRIVRIVGYLYDTYGITLDVSTMKIRSIEINRTFLTDYAFPLYERPIVFTMSLLSPLLRLKEQNFFPIDHCSNVISKQRRIPSTYIKDSGKRGIAVKFYDKGTQLREITGIVNFPPCMRFELTLKAPKKVRDYLRSDLVSRLTDERINRCLNQFVTEHILDHYPNRLHQRDVYIEKLFRSLSKSGDRYWRRSFLLELIHKENSSHIPVLLSLDFATLRPILMKAFPKCSRSYRHDTLESLETYCAERCPVLLQGDESRLQELFKKLLPKGEDTTP